MPLYAEKATGFDHDNPAHQSSGDGGGGGALSEGFDIGYDVDADADLDAVKYSKFIPTDVHSLYGDNQWPSEENLPDFRETYLKYFSRMLSLSRDLMRIFALALEIDEEFFDSKARYPGAMSRMLHYPPQPVQEMIVEGLGAHTVS